MNVERACSEADAHRQFFLHTVITVHMLTLRIPIIITNCFYVIGHELHEPHISKTSFIRTFLSEGFDSHLAPE